MIFLGFFQQDEWFAFSEYIRISKNFGDLINNLFAFNVTHYVPLGRLAGYLEFQLFRLNYLPYAILGLLLHVGIAIAIYYLVKRIFENKAIAIISAFIFIFADYGYQVISWPTGNLANQLSIIISLGSLIFFLRFLKEEKSKLFWISYFLLLLSLTFKENAIAFFLFLPILFLKYSKSSLRKKYFYPLVIFVTGTFYGLFRVLMVLVTNDVAETAVGSHSKFTLIYNILTFPIKAIVQTIIPINLELSIAKKLSFLFPIKVRGEVGTTTYDVFLEKRILEGLTFVLFTMIIAIIIVMYKKIKGEENKKIILFATLFIILNSFIYALSPERSGIIPIIDSRNLYFLTVGSSIIVGTIIYLLMKKKRLVGNIFLFIFFGINIFYLKQDVTIVQEYSNVRQNILNQIKSDHPTLPNPVIFYTESSSSFYGLPESERILPFQSGFGKTLLVWYEKENRFPTGFFNDFLWPIQSQGYKEIDGVGFGYFRDFEKLAKFVKENNFNKDTIISYSFNSEVNSLKNITKQIQGRLRGYESKKNIINLKQAKITPSVNEKDIKNAVDGSIKTSWDSKLPYSNYQFIDVDLQKNYNIAEVLIDSGTDINQKSVGYRISISENGKDWIEVFESKRHPAVEEGKDSLYFEPTKGRYVKIEQIGNHKYSSWIINELNIYEKN